jgi:hypothetical protein
LKIISSEYKKNAPGYFFFVFLLRLIDWRWLGGWIKWVSCETRAW